MQNTSIHKVGVVNDRSCEEAVSPYHASMNAASMAGSIICMTYAIFRPSLDVDVGTMQATADDAVLTCIHHTHAFCAALL